MEDERWLMMAVLDHLKKASQRNGVNSDAMQEAMFAIANAYSLNMHNAATKERYPISGLSLPDVYKAGREKLLNPSANGDASAEGETGAMDVDNSPHPRDDKVFLKFVARLKETTTFFKDVEEGSAEYERRLERARERFESRRAEKRQRANGTSSEDASGSREDQLALAEKLKIEGNEELKDKNYERAYELYTRCIEIDENNAVFYSNRAAATLHMGRYSEAVEDCKHAISLDPTFLRPRERLAASYRCLGMRHKEIEVLKEAIELAPQNNTLKAYLSDAENFVAGRGFGSAPRSTGMGGSGGGSGGSGGSGLESLLGSADPSMLSNMASAMGLNLPPGAVESFLNSGAADQIGGMLRDNPGIMQQAMQAMMGGGMPGMGSGNQGNGNNANRSNQR